MKAVQGIKQRPLCEQLGLDYKAVALSAKQAGMSTHQYLQQETGWVLHQELYYPPGTSVESIMLNRDRR